MITLYNFALKVETTASRLQPLRGGSLSNTNGWLGVAEATYQLTLG